MDINTADFPVGRAVIYVSEDQCIYDMPTTKLESAWNTLAKYYSVKFNSGNVDAIKTNEFYREVAHCNVENETALTVYQLVQQNIIRTYPCLVSAERPVSLARYMLQSAHGILVKRVQELKRNIVDEIELFDKIKGVSHEIKIENGEICVYFTQTCILTFKNLKELYERQINGLSCVITFKNMKLSYFEEMKELEHCGLIGMHFYAQMLSQSYERDGLSVKIGNEPIAGKDELCKTVVKELKKGVSLEQIHELIIIGLSRVCVESLVDNCKLANFVSVGDVKLADGLSEVFFVLTEENVLKVVRKRSTFDIYLNGNLLMVDPENV